MGLSYEEVLGEIIYDYESERNDIYHNMKELYNFSDHPVEYHYASIKRLIRYLRKEHEKVIIWWRKYPLE